MYLTGLVHRDRLHDISMRWFGDNPLDDDGRVVTEIFLFEPLITGPTLRRFVVDVLSDFTGDAITYENVIRKEVVRERVVQAIPSMTPRLMELVREYREHPEEYFPRTPVDGVIFRAESTGRLVAMSRIKRPRRIAEKAARRMADRLIGLIREVGEYLASVRAQQLGVPAEELISTDEEMDQDFMTAERMVARQFETGTIVLRPDEIQIDDVLGTKLIGTPEEIARIESILLNHPRAKLIEREEHSGRYNAVNVQMDLTLPPAGTVIDRVRDIDWSFAAKRGIPQANLEEDFYAYVESGPRTVRIEVVLTTYPELVESEIGRSIHERRILRVRDAMEYKGRIARNAAFIIEYLLTLAYSPQTHAEAIPIKLWGHYLPEALEYAISEMYGIRHTGLMFHHYLPLWADERCKPYKGTGEPAGGTATFFGARPAGS